MMEDDDDGDDGDGDGDGDDDDYDDDDDGDDDDDNLNHVKSFALKTEKTLQHLKQCPNPFSGLQVAYVSDSTSPQSFAFAQPDTCSSF